MQKKMTKQYRWQLMRKARGLCYICGKPGLKSSASRMCAKHIAAKTLRDRKDKPVKRVHIPREVWAQLDWSIGCKAVAEQVGSTIQCTKANFARLLVAGKVRKSDCPDYDEYSRRKARKRIARVLDSI